MRFPSKLSNWRGDASLHIPSLLPGYMRNTHFTFYSLALTSCLDNSHFMAFLCSEFQSVSPRPSIHRNVVQYYLHNYCGGSVSGILTFFRQFWSNIKKERKASSLLNVLETSFASGFIGYAIESTNRSVQLNEIVEKSTNASLRA